jgi:acetyl esterase/lipase
VGRTPESAPDPLVRLFLCPNKADQGVVRRPGGPPHEQTEGATMRNRFGSAVLFCALALTPRSAFSQLSPSAAWATHAANEYQIFPNVTYLTASNVELKLDVYQRRGMTTPQPTVIYMHGGFWVAGAKEGATMALMPWLEMGWNVVNVEYRLGRVALAPAALEDCFCALRFLSNQAKTYNIDLNRIVVTGESAGGHLALSLGIIPESAGLDREGLSAPLPKVAAVINWF